MGRPQQLDGRSVTKASRLPVFQIYAAFEQLLLASGELRVLLALARGVGAKEAADLLGISEATVRTHLQQMFSKTGTSRQADLLLLLQSSAPPIKANQLA
jgi:DNA-binding CsgD family transcriptional regulator